MRVERLRPHVLRLTAHAHELAALMAAARWAAEGGAGGLPREAQETLQRVVAAYDEALSSSTEAPEAPGAPSLASSARRREPAERPPPL